MTRIANDNTDATTAKPADDNTIQPFQLELSGLRGRMVRLGSTLNDLISAHSYAMPVAKLLAEAAVTSILLSSMLKYDGIFTLQTSGDGPVRTLVADMTTAGALRAYAGYNEETVRAMQLAAEKPLGGQYEGFKLGNLVGKGYLAFTVDQGEFMERYQGIVALSGDTLVETVQHYFDQSEQIGTSLKVAVAYDPATGWRGGGVMLQRMPDPSIAVTGDPSLVPFRPELAAEKDEDWNRGVVLMQSVSDAELADPGLHSHDLLLRLFHEEGVRIFETQNVVNQCRCSPERVSRVLSTLPPEDREHAAVDGVIEMTCEFCSRKYRFYADTLECVAVEPDQKTN